MKKSVLLVPFVLASSLAVSLPAFAAKGAAYVAPAPVSDSYYHSGFYLGGAVGGNQYLGNIEQELHVEYIGAYTGAYTTFGNYEQDYEAKSSGVMGQIQLGYAYINDWFFGALEVSLNGAGGTTLDRDYETLAFDSVEGTSLGMLDSDMDIELNSLEPVVDLKLGFKVTPNSLLYARVGAAFNEIEIKDHVRFSETIGDINEPLVTTMSASESNSVVGLRLGVGAEQRFTPNLAVTLDYIYTNYGSVDASQVADTAFYGKCPDSVCFYEDGMFVSDEVDVTRNVVMLGMNYYF